MENTHKRVGLYLRISADPTGEKMGVDAQRAACIKMIQAQGWTHVDTYEDNDISATDGSDRPQWNRLLGDISSKRIDRVLAWEMARYSRDDADDARDLKKALKKAGAVLTIHGGSTFNVREPTDALLYAVMSGVSAFETDQKNKRAMEMNVVRRMRGEADLRSRVFGWQINLDKLGKVKQNPYDCTIVDEREAAVVRWVYDQILDGNDNIREIVRQLNKNDVRSVNGKEFSSQTVKAMLTMPLYGGIPYRVIKSDADGYVQRRRYELYPDITPQWTPIVDRDKWERVQVLLAGKKSFADRGRKGVRQNWLSGVLKCGVCQRHMFQNGAQLVCVRALDHHLSIKKETALETIEPYVIRTIALEGTKLRQSNPEADRVKAIREQLAKLEKSRERARELEDEEDRYTELNRLSRQRKALQEETMRLNAGRSILQIIADLVPMAEDGVISMERAAENVRAVTESWQELSIAQKSKAADSLGSYVVAKADKASGYVGAKRITIYGKDPRTGEIFALDEDPQEDTESPSEVSHT